MKGIYFERALFISWFCALGDCSFCYMSTQKSRISDPRKARRSSASILAEAILAKKLDWKIGFVSGGVHSFARGELVVLLNQIHQVFGAKFWLNLGILSESLIKELIPITEGICSTVECINKDVHDKVCPSKPMDKVLKQFKICDKYNLKKSITIIIGLGETEEDIPILMDFIQAHSVSKVIFYALNPIRGTVFKKGPEKSYFLKWIKMTRLAFPDLDIVVGHWVGRIDYVPEMLDAGADSITKYPALKLFGSSHSVKLDKIIADSGREFVSNLTKMPEFDIDAELAKYDFDASLKSDIRMKLQSYLALMQKAAKK